MRNMLLALCVAMIPSASANAATIVLVNFTPKPLEVKITTPNRPENTVTISPAQVLPVTVSGPSTIHFTTTAGPAKFHLEPYNAYVFLPDEKMGLRFEGIELPGAPPEHDARPELNPAPAVPVKIPVTLLVDDADPRTDKLWHETLRKRFDEAASVIESHSGVRFEFAAYATWTSEPGAKSVTELLLDFERKVRVKPGQFAIGYTSRKVEDKPNDPSPFGTSRPAPTRHLLMREFVPKGEVERTEALIHHLGLALGATISPDGGSVMRAKIADGLALVPQYQFRFDPLNALVMSVWADELRRGPIGAIADVTPLNQIRLKRIYAALLKAQPGETLALTYLNELGNDMAQAVPMKDPGVAPAAVPMKQIPPGENASREVVARAVIKAITELAKSNGENKALSGDALTLAYVRAAASTALTVQGLPPDSPQRVAGFLIGLGIALDDTEVLRSDTLTQTTVLSLESDADREVRLAVLGNPTIRGRRDFCRRFAEGCTTGELLAVTRAEEVAIDRTVSLATARKASGISLPGMACEFAGVSFGKFLREEPNRLRKISENPDLAQFIPSLDGLRDGLSADRFDEEFSDASSDRFQPILADIRERVKLVQILRSK